MILLQVRPQTSQVRCPTVTSALPSADLIDRADLWARDKKPAACVESLSGGWRCANPLRNHAIAPFASYNFLRLSGPGPWFFTVYRSTFRRSRRYAGQLEQVEFLMSRRLTAEATRVKDSIGGTRFSECSVTTWWLRKNATTQPLGILARSFTTQTPGAVERVRGASHEFGQKQREAITALIRLNNYSAYWTVPPGFGKS